MTMSKQQRATLIAEVSQAVVAALTPTVLAGLAQPQPQARPARKERKPQARKVQAQAPSRVRRMWDRQYTVGRVYPAHLVAEVAGATECVLSSSGTLFWYGPTKESRRGQLHTRKASAAEAKALRTQYADTCVVKPGRE